ncbi:copper resistance CopC family protein [Neptunomonas phycophila]|uniref:copper resistance CopC family protein n=1 Tax=Neptunomonas phycophila TaxID=1572645 RepID=UPI0023F96340|nr:copper resistance CopC family protein [Neptunomonas phycophila]
MKQLKTLIAAAALASSSNLFAHGMMGMTYPQDGAMMMEPTDRVEVKFEMPMKLVNLKVVDSAGKPVAIDFDRSKEASTHFKVMMPNLKADNYEVRWKAMSDDGHMMKGSFGFMQH